MDSGQNDLGKVDNLSSTDWAALASACDARGATCVAINSEGWLKSKLRPIDQWGRYADGDPFSGTLVKGE